MILKVNNVEIHKCSIFDEKTLIATMREIGTYPIVVVDDKNRVNVVDLISKNINDSFKHCKLDNYTERVLVKVYGEEFLLKNQCENKKFNINSKQIFVKESFQHKTLTVVVDDDVNKDIKIVLDFVIDHVESYYYGRGYNCTGTMYIVDKLNDCMVEIIDNKNLINHILQNSTNDKFKKWYGVFTLNNTSKYECFEMLKEYFPNFKKERLFRVNEFSFFKYDVFNKNSFTNKIIFKVGKKSKNYFELNMENINLFPKHIFWLKEILINFKQKREIKNPFARPIIEDGYYLGLEDYYSLVIVDRYRIKKCYKKFRNAYFTPNEEELQEIEKKHELYKMLTK